MKKTKFIKKGNRYNLTPKERILQLIKKYQEVSTSRLSTEAKIQYDVTKKIIEELNNDGLIKIESTSYYDSNNQEQIVKIILDRSMKKILKKS